MSSLYQDANWSSCEMGKASNMQCRTEYEKTRLMSWLLRFLGRLAATNGKKPHGLSLHLVVQQARWTLILD